jgi:hypothetical protein
MQTDLGTHERRATQLFAAQQVVPADVRLIASRLTGSA